MAPPKVIIVPPAVACMPRSPHHLQLVIDSLQLETNLRLQRRPLVPNGKVFTFCNQAVELFCDAMGVHIPKGLLARQQIAWLRSVAGREIGWAEVVPEVADVHADQGCPVLVGWTNPDETDSSHIAMMREAKRIAQAGKRNFSDGSISMGFGTLPVKYFAHL